MSINSGDVNDYIATSNGWASLEVNCNGVTECRLYLRSVISGSTIDIIRGFGYAESGNLSCQSYYSKGQTIRCLMNASGATTAYLHFHPID